MTKSYVTNEAVITASNQRIRGMQTHVATRTKIPVGGRLLTHAAIVATYKKSLATRAKVLAALAAYKAALVERDETESQRVALDDGLKAWVVNMFGVDSPQAFEFGFTPRKTREVTAETRAKAVRLNKATREARGTVGKKKKLKIKGTLAPPTRASDAEPGPAAAPTATPAP